MSIKLREELFSKKEIEKIKKTKTPYDDIISLESPISKHHKRMSILDRAPQFAPFSALVGYEDCIEETKRLTDGKIVLDENEKNILDEKIKYILSSQNKPNVKILYFKKDELKEGGKYLKITTKILKVNLSKKILFLENNIQIFAKDIIDIEIINDEK